MRLHRVLLGAALARRDRADGSADGQRRRRHLRAAADLSHRPVRGFRHADRQRHGRLPQHAQRARRRHRRRQAHRRGMRDRLRHQEGRRVLRAGQGEEPGRASIRIRPASRCSSSRRPRSTRSRSCRWPTACRLRPTAHASRGSSIRRRPIGTARRCSSAMSAARKAGSTSSRARRSASSISTRPTARSRSRCSSARQGLRLRAQALSGAGSRNAEPVVAVAQHPPRPAGLDLHAGLRRDEPDRRQGSRQDQLSDGSPDRQLVGRQ